jgi:nucleoid DNA-binding protein
MNKRELTQFVAKATKLSETQTEKTINAVLEGIKKGLREGRCDKT